MLKCCWSLYQSGRMKPVFRLLHVEEGKMPSGKGKAGLPNFLRTVRGLPFPRPAGSWIHSKWLPAPLRHTGLITAGYSRTLLRYDATKYRIIPTETSDSSWKTLIK